MNSNRLEYMNAVRGIAIVMVIILHACRAVKNLPDIVYYLSNRGAFGVQLFFVASAFTLFLSYAKRKETDGDLVKANFFIRRFFRISPMYYFAALLYSIIFFYYPAYNDGHPLVLWKIVANIFYLNGVLPGAINYLPPGGWSVGVEMVFYCAVPFLFQRIKNIKSATIVFIAMSLASVALKLLIRYILISKGMDYKLPESWFLYFWVPNQAPVFILGFILYFALKKYSIKSKALTYLAMLISCTVYFIFTYFYNALDPAFVLPEHIIAATFFTFNIFLLAQHPASLFNNKLTRMLGELSFSLYLVHFIVIYLIADFFPLPENPYYRLGGIFIVTMLISIAISKLTYQYIELKGIALGNKLIKRLSVSAKPELELKTTAIK